MTPPIPPPDRQVAVSFLAHPDDAEILCAGTLIRLADAGWEVHIITATAGDCGTIDQTPQQISAIRTEENRAAAKVIGATYHCMGELDLRIVYDRPTLQKATDLLRIIAPTLVFTHAPKDYMPDHEVVSFLGRAATFGYAVPNASTLPLLPDSCIPHLYYCDPIEAIDPFGHEVKPTAYVDITEQMPRKDEMLKCHASQRDWLRAHHGMDEYIEAMHRHGELRGKQNGCQYAEGFIQHRGHGYPHDDLLATLFPPTPR